jgi:hypothetical protein
VIQITRIPFLDPYHRRRPDAAFTTCPGCKQTYQPAARMACCPHPVISPNRLLTAGDGKSQIAVREKKTRNRAKTGKRPPLVLEEPYFLQQVGESDLWFGRFVTFRDLGSERTLTKVAQIYQTEYSGVRAQAKEYKWEIRARAYDTECEKERRALARKLQRKRVERDLSLVDAGKTIVAAEYRALLKEVVERRGTTGLDFDELTSAYEKLVKLGRLLIGESTENIQADTAEMANERRLRDAVHDIQQDLQERETSHPDESPEDRSAWLEQRLDWGAEDYNADRAALAQAVVGYITTSQAEN